jgi:very-short-patch-repair endonuclease
MADSPHDARIARLAARQHGVVTRQQLLAIGLGRGAIETRQRTGRLHVVHLGVYLVGHPSELPHAREMAAVLACGEGTAISHRSAAGMRSLAHGFTHEGVEVTIQGRSGVRRPGIRVHRTRAWATDDIDWVEGIPVTSTARTILDIARFLTMYRLEHVVADAERRGLVLRTQLNRELARHRGRRGAAALRAVLDAEPAFTRSAAERRLLALLRDASLPSPITNARVGSHEVDFLWPRERLIVEVDGFQWHSDRTAFERDRVRDAELQALGYRVIRVTWRMLQHEPRAVVARIAATLRRAADPPSHR